MRKIKITSGVRYVDGVEKLHRRFFEIAKNAYKLSFKYISKLEDNTSPPNSRSLYIWVDFTEEQPENALRAYFVFEGIIHRFLSVEFDCSLLFPVRNYEKKETYSGVTYNKIQYLKNNKKCVLIRFSKPLVNDENDMPLLRCIPFSDSSLSRRIKDDIGRPYYSFSDINALSIIDIPSSLFNKEYAMVREEHYAPLTTSEECYCVLYAEIDNEHDLNAIKVLRWFPRSRRERNDNLLINDIKWHDVFFELGYICSQENLLLHSFMTENDSRLLFAKKTGSSIKLMGTIKIFLSNDLNYPSCISNIKVK